MRDRAPALPVVKVPTPGIALCIFGVLLSPCLKGASCDKVMTVSEVIRSAPKLDSHVVCVRGLVDVTGVLFEMTPLRGAKQNRQTVGLIDWSPGMGIASSLYKPESFKLLSDIKRRTPSLDITLRAGVFYKRHFLAEIEKKFSKNPEISKIPRTPHDVELIVLEILNAKNSP